MTMMINIFFIGLFGAMCVYRTAQRYWNADDSTEAQMCYDWQRSALTTRNERFDYGAIYSLDFTCVNRKKKVEKFRLFFRNTTYFQQSFKTMRESLILIFYTIKFQVEMKF